MDEASQLELDRLVKLDPEELTWDEASFLTARRSYLSKRDQETFQEVIDRVLAASELKLKQEAEEKAEKLPAAKPEEKQNKKSK